MIVRQYRPEDLQALIEAHGVEMLCPVDPYYAGALIDAGPCYTVEADGAPICAAGIANLWSGRAEAWAVMAPATRHRMTGITRHVRTFLDACDVRRIDCAVRADFVAGLRWVTLLGFACEGLMRRFGPDGLDYYRYARVRS